MATKDSRKRYFKSSSELKSHQAYLKEEQARLKREIVKDMTNPLTIGTAVSKNVMNLFNRRKNNNLIGAAPLISPQNTNKRNILNVAMGLLNLRSWTGKSLLKFFFRNVKRTNWFKWQLIFIFYSIVRFFWKRSRKKSKQAALK